MARRAAAAVAPEESEDAGRGVDEVGHIHTFLFDTHYSDIMDKTQRLRSGFNDHSSLLLQGQIARLLRCFSADQDMLVFFNSNGDAVPITRQEQDRWIGDIEEIAENYVDDETRAKPLFTIFGIGAFFLTFFSAQIISLWFSVPTLAVIVLITASLPYIRYRKKCRELFHKIEIKTQFRDPVILTKPKRGNFFGRMHLILLAMAMPLTFIICFSSRYLNEKTIAVLILIDISLFVLMALFMPLSQKIDKKHTARTGKWFRDWL